VKRAVLAPLFLLLSLAACTPKPAPIKNVDAIEADIDKQMGGIGTCVILADTRTGAVLYQYNSDTACNAPLPPCATFNIPTSLIGLDAGVVTPATVVKWDGTPQPVKALETDADIAKAYKNSIDWWFQRLAGQIGHDRYAQALKAYDYGNKTIAGPLPLFWEGPHSGGGLDISTRQQAAFLARLYAGKLPVKSGALTAVETLMVNETRTGPGVAGGKYVMSGETGSCPSQADGSRNVGWWVGRLKTPKRDLVFAASVEGANAPPGAEVEATMKDILANAGFWPQG
jgi:beta-lactamase class D